MNEDNFCGCEYIDRLGTSFTCGDNVPFVGGKMQCPWCKIDFLQAKLDKTIEAIREELKRCGGTVPILKQCLEEIEEMQ